MSTQLHAFAIFARLHFSIIFATDVYVSPWTPGDALQAEDRVRRIGQTKSVRSIWMRAFDIDKQIDELIEHKNQNTNAVVGAKNVASSQSNVNKAAPKISIRQLIHAIVAKKDSKEAG